MVPYLTGLVKKFYYRTVDKHIANVKKEFKLELPTAGSLGYGNCALSIDICIFV